MKALTFFLLNSKRWTNSSYNILSSFIEISYRTSSGSLVVPSQPSGITLKSGLYGRDATWNSLSWQLKNLRDRSAYHWLLTKNVIMTSAWHCNCRCCRLFIILKKKILQRRCRTHQLHAVRHIISISNYYGLKKYRYYLTEGCERLCCCLLLLLYLTEGCADPSSERNIEKNCTRDVDVYNVLKCISTNHSARQLDM